MTAGAGPSVSVVGASVRAAAQSAARAGLRVDACDLFGDTDLLAVARFRLCDTYPEGFGEFLRARPDRPWLYTGGLENRPDLIDAWSRFAPLWGNGAQAVRAVRCPRTIGRIARAAGWDHPETRPSRDPPTDRSPGDWLVKRPGSAGLGVSVDRGGPIPEDAVLQRRLAGNPRSALFVSDGRAARLLGASRILLERDLAPPTGGFEFRYAGNIGPVPIDLATRDALDRLGGEIARAAGLRGVWGIDWIEDAAGRWLLEINPRYPASAELFEESLGVSIVGLHRQACVDFLGSIDATVSPHTVVGKAILYSDREGRFDPDRLPAGLRLADLPGAGTPVGCGKPALTWFGVGRDEEEVSMRLRATRPTLLGAIVASDKLHLTE